MPPAEAIRDVDRTRIEHVGTGGGHPEILLAGTSGDGTSMTGVLFDCGDRFCGGPVRGGGGWEVSGQPSALASSGSRQTHPRPFDAPTHAHRSAADVRVQDARSQ
ncbi:hypothetical protein GCM10022204_40420 [Microlunatus aurantiacus]|uniref:Uncharacterized protein n=1 Tax=Microlunatus aurantiacus TaxID=446786 RepID=A0ABP7EAL6_9ACTN